MPKSLLQLKLAMSAIWSWSGCGFITDYHHSHFLDTCLNRVTCHCRWKIARDRFTGHFHIVINSSLSDIHIVIFYFFSYSLRFQFTALPLAFFFSASGFAVSSSERFVFALSCSESFIGVFQFFSYWSILEWTFLFVF